MKVLVLGGTGAMGTHLAELLSVDNIETVVTTRSSRLSDGKVSYIKGNAHDIEFLQILLKDYWDAIIDFMVYKTPEFKNRVNLLLSATSQYVFLSSARVYAKSEKPLTEDSPRLLDISKDQKYLNTDEYALTKARQEDVLKKSGYKNWTIIRPYITYGENRLQLGVLEKEEWLYRALQGRTIVFSSDMISKFTTLTYGLDVSKGIVSILGKSSALGEAYHITGNTPCLWKNILEIYSDILEEHLGRKPKVVVKELDEFLKIHPAKYQVKYDRLFNRQFDNSNIAQYIDIKSFIAIESGLKDCLREFLKNPNFKQINWIIEAKKDRQTNEHTQLTEIKGIKMKLRYLAYRYFYLDKIKK